ncbi:ATP-binding protein, partial [Streptacidiphilus griseoplanus]|uniref:ATP-binding protein n=1 Tax=Peterkaempfera griseoplana TaxID=66896 RepID=UPI0006E2B803
MPDEPSWQELIHRHQAREFVGRDQELAWFRGNLALPVAERRFVVNIHGDAGVGKSFLLEELRRIAADTAGAATARVAEDCRSLLDVWEALGTQLVEQGCLPRSFPQRVATVAQQLRAAAAPDGGAADEPSPAGRLAAGVGVAAVQALPVVGPFAGLISPDQVAQGAHQLGTAVGRRLRNPSADGHGTDEDQLSRAFVEGLRTAGGRPLLLCFDTYERLEPVADQWLRDLVHGRYGRVPATVMLVVSGQRPLRADRWAPLLPVTAAMRLRVFTQEETREYLANRGITDPEVVRVVEGLSGRLPVLVATLARTRPAGVEEVGDPSGDAVERFLRWEPDPQRRDFAVRSALPRTLDGDVLELLAGPRDDGRLGAWLRSMPFIQDQGRVLRFHEVVRTAMLRYQHNLAPRRWAALHRELAAGFGRWRQEADSGADEGHGDDWWQLRREEYYHLLCADGERRLTEALNEAADGGSIGPVSARAWAEVLRDAGRDGEHPALLAWGARLSTVLDAPADDPSGYLTLLIDFAALQPAVRAQALAARARHHFAFDRETQAAADCDRALRLSPDDPALLVERARIHRWEGEFDQALDCLARALERQPGSAAGRTLRGWVLLDAGRSEEAAQAFAAVLETTPQNESARLGLSFTAHRRGDHEEALR